MSFLCVCLCVLYQNITAHKTPGRATRNTTRNTPFKPTTSAAPADRTGSSLVGQSRSPRVETRPGHATSPRGQMESPKVPVVSRAVPTGKSPAIVKLSSDGMPSPATDKSRHHAASDFVKDFGADVDLERFNTTESDEDIAKACGQMEDEVDYIMHYRYYYLFLYIFLDCFLQDHTAARSIFLTQPWTGGG